MATDGISDGGGARIKHDWYQTAEHVVVTVLARNLSPEHVTVHVLPTTLNVTARLPTGADYQLRLSLCHPVDPQRSSHAVLASKLEVKLSKSEAHHWPSLEGSGETPTVRSAAAADTLPPAYPSSARSARDWDAIASQIKRDEEKEEPQGEEAVNKLFQKIYSDGSDEVKKAMVKSFTESGGTVLSTNWSDIGSKNTDVKPPDGMEYRKWEQ